MSNLRKIIGALLLALCMSIVAPATVPLTLNISTVEAAKVKLSKSKATLIKGQTLKLEVKNTSKKVKWSTSDKKIATVTSSGKVKAKKTGTVTIIAKVGNKQYKCKIKVETPKISNSSLNLIKGSSQTINMTGNTQKVKWSTSNKNIATVSNKGKITAKKKGNATITATIGSKKYICKVTVNSTPTTTYFNKAITYETYNTGDFMVAVFKNNSSYSARIEPKIIYYKNGNMVYTSDANYLYMLEGNKEAATYFFLPNSDYDNFKIELNAMSTTGTKYTDIVGKVDYIKVSSNRSSDGVTARITNTYSKELSSIAAYCLFYKNGKVADFRLESLSNMSSGQSEYVQFSTPYDDINNCILDYDSYKIIINNAYYYIFD